MVRVCVVGGGTAGAEAASEAARGGAEVTVIERSEGPEPPWRTWPDLIRPSGSPGDAAVSSRRGTGNAAATTLVKEARSVGPGFVSTSDGSKVRFESVVVATGCGFDPLRFPGLRKPGVFLLDRADQYAQLGLAACAMGEVVVQGDGIHALRVADRLSGSGRRIHVLAPCWEAGEPSAVVMAVLLQAAEEQGVSVTRRTVTKAVGSGSLEAAVIGGKVVSCDALAVLPSRVPRVVQMQARLGRKGGLLVDASLRTSSPMAFAAGGCAELETVSQLSESLAGEAAMSGRIAGANTAGSQLSIGFVRFSECTFFGLRWTKAGVGPPSARALGTQMVEVSRRWDQASACAIAYERHSGRVLGIESIEEAKTAPAVMPLPASGPTSLRSLAYGWQGGSSDISLVSDTARMGLRDWRRS